MVVRDESGNILETNRISTTELYEHHIYAIERIRKATVSGWTWWSLYCWYFMSFSDSKEFVQQKSSVENNE